MTSENNERCLDVYYTRITFNSNNWKMPSGTIGKSSNPNSFEGVHGFGFEEWIFDDSTLINGKKYAFIQGVARSVLKRKTPRKLILFTINNITKERIHIATLGKWKYFEDNKNDIQSEFEKKGWLKNMREQILKVGADENMFDTVVAQNGTEPLFNVCFEFEDLEILKQTKIFPQDHRIQTLNRYLIYEL